MSPEILALLAIAQAGIVLLLFGLLLWNRVARSLVDRRHERQRRKLVELLERWQRGEQDLQSVADGFAGTSLRAQRAALDLCFDALGQRERDALVDAVRSTRWTRKVHRHAAAVFWWHRMDAAQILGYLGRRKDVPVLGRLLGDRHPAVKLATVFTARRLTFTELLMPLLDEAVVAEPTRRKSLQDALLAYGDRLTDALMERFASAEEEDELVTCLTLAGRLARRASASRLTRSVMDRADDERLEVRIAAVRALGSFEEYGAPVHRVLRTALDDEAWQVRAQAAGALGVLAVEACAGDLRRALRDPTWWVRLRAAIALRQVGGLGRQLLEAVDPEDDPFAHDMASYVLRLDEAVVAEYAV